MRDTLITPGYVWTEIDPHYADKLSMPQRVIGEIDLKSLFPIGTASGQE
jgi:hypothetical protein